MNRIGIWRGGKSSIFVDLLIYSSWWDGMDRLIQNRKCNYFYYYENLSLAHTVSLFLFVVSVHE